MKASIRTGGFHSSVSTICITWILPHLYVGTKGSTRASQRMMLDVYQHGDLALHSLHAEESRVYNGPSAAFSWVFS